MIRFLRYASLLLMLLLTLQEVQAQPNQYKDMHRVKQGETIYGIARAYGISVDVLKRANPKMNNPDYVLSIDEYVFIPDTPNTSANTNTNTSTGSTFQPSLDKGVRGKQVNIAVMLPLHNVDGDGKRMVEYYRGILMACHQLKQEGVSINIHAWNVPADADIRQILLENSASQVDYIFGPLYSKQLKHLAGFAKSYGIKVVVPFSISSNEVNSNSHVFQIYQDPNKQNEKSVNAFLERFPHHHPVFIDCNDSTINRKGSFTMALRKQLDKKKTIYNITNLRSAESDFSKAFSRTMPNVVVLNTSRSPELGAAIQKLELLTQNHPELKISLFGYTEWLMYTRPYAEKFHKYDTYIPTTSYHNVFSAETKDFETKYIKQFGEPMMYALPRFAITGYDHANYFIRGLLLYGKDFSGAKTDTPYIPLQTPLYFRKVSKNGGLQNESFMLIHYTPQKNIESISY